MAIRCAVFQVDSVAGASWKEASGRWRELAEQVQQATNYIWRSWELHHVREETPEKLGVWLARLRAWHEKDKSKRGKKPKCVIKAMDSDLANSIYHALRERMPQMNVRTLVLTQNMVTKKICGIKSASGNLPGWMSILLCRQGRPSTIHLNPIPFDAANSRLVPPHGEQKNWGLVLRVSRDAGAKRACDSTVLDELVLRTAARKMAGQTAVLQRIMAGIYKIKGSSLFVRDKKWFVAISYEMPEFARTDLDDSLTAFLRASRHHPFLLKLPGRNRWPGGDGRYVASIRRQLLTQRWSRQSNYRNAGSSNKGHGLRRALDPIWKLSQRWKDFTKRVNHQISRDVVNQLIAARVGRLVYFAPRGDAYLVTAGKISGRSDSTGWDWYQFRSLLARKCEDAGVEIVVREKTAITV